MEITVKFTDPGFATTSQIKRDLQFDAATKMLREAFRAKAQDRSGAAFRVVVGSTYSCIQRKIPKPAAGDEHWETFCNTVPHIRPRISIT